MLKILLVLFIAFVTVHGQFGKQVRNAGRRIFGSGTRGTPAIYPKFCDAQLTQSRTNPFAPANLDFNSELRKFVEAKGLKTTVQKALPGAMPVSQLDSDENVIRMYTAEVPAPFYRYVNCWLHNPSQPNKPRYIDGFVQALTNTLNRQKDFQGLHFRGSALDVVPVVGDVIRNKGFLSTARNQGTAISFLKMTQNPAYLFIFNSAGKDITAVNPTEQEILIPSGKCFLVQSVAKVAEPAFPMKFPELAKAGVTAASTPKLVAAIRLQATSCVNIPVGKQIQNILTVDTQHEEYQEMKNDSDYAKVEELLDEFEGGLDL